jgi:NAD(P)-dependent dehydrogenase (short-subunit alcohol dehydrogenase family)
MTYGWETTTDELLEGRDLSGQRVLITGGSAGLGRETARALGAHGADVVIAVRDLAKGERAAAPVRAGAAPNASVELIELDLASLASVRACADRLLAEGKPLDVLIANAGVMACPQGTTKDGFETQFGTNHLGHFVFVNRLVPLVVAGAPSRIVALSSSGHRMSDVDLDDPGFERTPYDPWVAYGRSKTANVLFALALDRRLRDRGVRACAVHPGGIQTELGRHLTGGNDATADGEDAAERGEAALQVCAAGRGDIGLGRRCRRYRGDRRALLRGLRSGATYGGR